MAERARRDVLWDVEAEVAIMLSQSMRSASPQVLVRLPGLHVSMFPHAQRRVEVSAASVDAMIDALDARWPGMRDRICDSTPAIRRHINIFVDGKRATLAMPLTAGADVFILTAISGG
jgi:molybdopterin converting factor small subunit